MRLKKRARTEQDQVPLWGDDSSAEDPAYLASQLITYIGNKRSLLGHIAEAVDRVKRRTGKSRLVLFDAFSGSGVVSRFLKAHASHLISNDLEGYAAAVARCYLRNRSTVDFARLGEVVTELNKEVEDRSFPTGFIEELYAPRDEACITREDRVFYTIANARRIDNYRRLFNDVDPDLSDLVMGPLLSKASVHANTAGVFKGFYKNKHTKIGQYGGSGSDALSRITGAIRLEVPILSRFECSYEIFQSDANALAPTLSHLDLTYIDPPYNQHPYGSNYFMLNLILDYVRPSEVSRVSGIPVDWQRSGYNVKTQALPLLEDLLRTLDSKFLLISFNDEGFISPSEMKCMLSSLGKVEVMETQYNAFRGSRSFEKRSIHVTEQLFLVERA